MSVRARVRACLVVRACACACLCACSCARARACERPFRAALEQEVQALTQLCAGASPRHRPRPQLPPGSRAAFITEQADASENVRFWFITRFPGS
jgi:hypothetical protein